MQGGGVMEADGDPSQRPHCSSMAAAGAVLLGCALLACVVLAEQETVLERVLPGTAASAIKLVRSTASSTLLGPLGPRMTPIEEWARFDHGYDEDTAETLRVIDEWQNPADCEHKKYILWKNGPSGLGSNIHTLGLGLAWAMDIGRILLHHPDDKWIYASEEHCPPDMINPDCYFRPLSRCQYMARFLVDEGVIAYNRDNHEWLSAKTLVLRDFWDLWGIIPAVVPNISDWHQRHGDQNGNDPWVLISWWRAISTRFFVRPKPVLQEFAREYLAGNLKRYPEVEGWSPSTNRPPPSAVCMHVRHGDKAVESAVHSMEEYMDAAQDILDRHPNISRNVILTFDNETLVDEMHRGAYDKYNVSFYYTAYERQRDNSSSMAMAEKVPNFGAISLANLFLGVHPNCKAFVEMGGSNWNRLIKEIVRTEGGGRESLPMFDFDPGAEWRQL